MTLIIFIAEPQQNVTLRAQYIFLGQNGDNCFHVACHKFWRSRPNYFVGYIDHFAVHVL